MLTLPNWRTAHDHDGMMLENMAMLMLMLVPMKMLLLLKLIATDRACRAEAGHLEEEEGELAGTVAAVEQQEDDGGRTDQGVLCRICQRGDVFV